MPHLDWLSQLLKIVTVTGQLEVRCAFGTPWRVAWPQSAANEMPYHMVLRGRAHVEDPQHGHAHELVAGDIVLLPSGSAHVLHDGSGRAPLPVHTRTGSAGWMLSRNDGAGEQLDMLCGRFVIEPPHDRLLRSYLPTHMVIHAGDGQGGDPSAGGVASASSQLAGLVRLMRLESDEDRLGGNAILDALSSALFALMLRAASETGQAPVGLLSLAGHPRLAPAITAMLAEPAHPWSLPELAGLCSMSRATFMRHFQQKLGRSAIDLLADIRMSVAANALNKPGSSTEAVAEAVGYQSVAAFRRVFTERMGITPGQWRRQPDAAHADR